MIILSIFCALFVLLVSPLFAQEYSLPYEHSTSSAPSTTTYFNFDIINPIYVDSSDVHKIIYRNQTDIVWNNADINQLYQACSTNTYSGLINYQPPSDILEWYFRSERDTAVVSQSPKNIDDLFPVPDYLMADLGADVVGDTENGGGNNVDIAHLFASYSSNKLYFRLDNNGGGFPTNSGLFTYYIYSIGLVNPNATDSIAYVLLYADNILFSTGLYSLNLIDSSFTNIGSVSSNISGNSLSLSCDIADLIAQPGWSQWPPDAGFVGVAPVTLTALLTDLSSNDFGKTAIFIPTSNTLDFSASNTAPILANQSISYDDTGLVSAEIIYTDAEDNLPAIRNFYFEGIPYNLQACDKTYENGALFEYQLIVSESNWYHYYFEFSDGVETVSTPLDSLYIELNTYICGDANGDGIVNILDISYIISYLYFAGLAPDPLATADVNNDGAINILDISLLIAYLYFNGASPECSFDNLIF